jgi:outer membrane protein assembly factor BamA
VKYVVIIFYVLFSSPTFLAQTKKPDSSRVKLGVLPTAFYAPETRLGAGAFVYSYFNTDKTNPRNKISNTQSYLSYTFNKQFSFENDYQIWLKSSKYYLTGGFDYSRFPEYYYGISNNTKESDRIMVSFDIIRVRSKNLYQLSNYLYAGVYYQFQKLYRLNTLLKNEHSMLCEVITGGAGYQTSGIGPIFIYDKRDNPLNPSQGAYIESSYQYFGKQTGSSFTFTSFILDIRKFKRFLNNKLIWNGSLFAHLNKGEVPYRMLGTIGGARHLRGYYQGRFRDNNLIIAQHEIRLPIYKWFGVAAFCGAGSVAKQYDDFTMNTIHYSYGMGLRLRINKKENTNIRIDYGRTRDSQGFYVVFAEAF